MSTQYAVIVQSNPLDGRGTYGTERAESNADWRFCTQASATNVIAVAGRSGMPGPPGSALRSYARNCSLLILVFRRIVTPLCSASHVTNH